MTNINTETQDEFKVQDDAEVQEMLDFDFERASLLMSIIEKQASVVPNLNSLSGIALAALSKMNDEAKDIARRRADRAKEAEQRRYEAEAERVRKEAEEAERAEANRPKAIPAAQVAPPPQGGQPSPERNIPRRDEPKDETPNGRRL